MKNFNTKFPAMTIFEEFEILKKSNPEIFVEAVREIIAYHHLSDLPLKPFDGTNIVFAYGNDRVIKIFPPLHHNQFMSEVLVMKHLHNKLSVQTPQIEYEGEIAGWPYVVMSRLDGVLLEGLWEKLDHNNKIIIMQELGQLIREVHALPIQGLETIDSHWQQFIDKQVQNCMQQHTANKLPENLLKQLPEYIKSAATILPSIKYPVLLTGEYTPMNFLVQQRDGTWHISGLIDFGDCMLGLPQYDLLGPGAFLIQGDKQLLREFLIAYGYKPEELTKKLSRQLTFLMLLHLYSNLDVQIRIENWKKKVKDLQDLEELVWGF